MELQVHDSNKPLTVADAAFAAVFNEPLVHQAIVAYLAGGRAGTRAQKGRSDVSGGGSKPWRQKGTGRARAGTIRSPLWRGGGRVFAAQPRDFSQKLNKKMYRAAMRSIFSELARQGRLVVVDALSVDAPKTQALVAKLAELSLGSALIVTDRADENLYLAARNLPHVDVTEVGGLDPVSLVGFEKVVISVAAVKQVEEWLG